MKKDFLVLTCTLGGKDILKDPPIQFESCDYIAIVDALHNVKTWNQLGHYDFSSIDSYKHRRNAKIYKILSPILFPDYKYIIWHDANHQLIKDPIDIIKEYGEQDLYLLKHPIRNCAYDEMDTVSGYLDSQENIFQQKTYYQNQGFPKNYNLFAMGNHIKQVNNKNIIFGLKWWEHVTKFSSRDQCSFPYCLWDMEKNNQKMNYAVLQGPPENTLRLNKYFIDYGTRLN
jgi:hypothetical protein